MRGLRLGIIFCVLIVVFIASMTAVYMLPQQGIQANLKASLKTFQSEGLRPRLLVDHPSFQLDNSTDAMMLDTSFVKRPRPPLVLAMADEHTSVTATWTPGAPGQAAIEPDPIYSLSRTVLRDKAPTIVYAYYWHGYQLFLRVALMLFPYSTIRYLLMISLALLAFFTLLAVKARAGTVTAVALFLALLFTGVYVVPLSLNFSTVFFVMLGSVLAALACDAAGILEKFDLELFLVVGMLTSFFDLLTIPVLTVGIPLAVALVLRSRRDTAPSFASQFRFYVRTGLAWVFGFGAGWIAKWFVASAILHTNVVRAGVAQFLFRVGARQGTMIGTALVGNLGGLAPLIGMYDGAVLRVRGDVVVFLLVVAVLLLAVFAWLLIRFRQPAEKIARALPVLLVAPLPYLWYVAANNHSGIHYGFTYRLQAMTLFALLYLALASIDWRRVADAFTPRGAKEPSPGE
jgi:hypothetical protein